MSTLETLIKRTNNYNHNEDGSWEKIDDMYSWISDADLVFTTFMKEMSIEPESYTGKAIQALSFDKLTQLIEKVSIEDDLIHIDELGFSVNHGSVGTQGIRYEFS